MIPGRVPPHDLDAERCVLGGILLDPLCIPGLAEVISPADFYREAHRKIYETQLELHEDREPVDRVTLKARLREHGALDAVGGENAIDLLDTIVPSAANLVYYGQIVKEAALARRMIEAAHTIASQGYERGRPVGELLDDAERRILALTREDSPRALGFQPIAKFMASTGQKPRWLLEPFVPVGSLVLVQGAPKSGKTFFAAWLACELARTGITTLFVEEEGSADMQGDRFRPFLADQTGADLEGRLMVAFRKRFRLDVSGRVDGLIGWIKDTKAQAVVLDPFKLLHQSDEQSASELTPVLDALQRVITETGCTIILLHHTKKGASWDKADNSDAQSGDARGSSAIIGSVDHILAVKGVPPAQRVPGEVRFILECADSRVAQPFDKRQGVVRLAGGPDALTWTETKASEDKAAALLERVLPVVPFEPRLLARTSIRKALNCNKTELDRAVRLGLQSGALREVSHKGLYRPGSAVELDHD